MAIKKMELSASRYLRNSIGHFRREVIALGEKIEEFGGVPYSKAERGSLQYQVTPQQYGRFMVWAATEGGYHPHKGRVDQMWVSDNSAFKIIVYKSPDVIVIWLIDPNAGKRI
jgi:hypothetical protein